MNDARLWLKKVNGHSQLIVDVPSDLETPIRHALQTISSSGPETAALRRLLEAFITASEQGYFWTAEWQAGEAAADTALAEGRHKTFDSMDNMLTFLDEQ